MAQKDKRKSMEQSNTLNNLIQHGQQLFQAALEEAKKNLPQEDEMVVALKGFAEKVSQVLETLVKDLNKQSEKAVEEVRSATQDAAKGLDGQSKRLKEEGAFNNPREAATRLMEVTQESLNELRTLMERLRPHADKLSQQIRTSVEKNLKKMNAVGDDIQKEIAKVLSKS